MNYNLSEGENQGDCLNGEINKSDKQHNLFEFAKKGILNKITWIPN